MRKTIQLEEKETLPFPEVDDAGFQPIAVREELKLEKIEHDRETLLLDSFVNAVKWVFLYLPGAVTIHFTLMALALFYIYEPPTLELILGTFGVFIVGMFLVMLGLGRLTDLRYLRAVAAMVAAGALSSILYSISIVFFPGDFFGWFTLLTLPLTIIIGQLVKIKTDRESLTS